MSAQLLAIVALVGGGLAALYALGAGASPAREGARRLQAVRLRHSEATLDRVEAQLRRAVAARQDALARRGSRAEALAARLRRTGRGWTARRYLQVSLGIGAAAALLVYLKTGAAVLALILGIALGLGAPHLAVGYLIGKRVRAFVTRFPDAIELLVRGLRSGLPVTETIAVAGAEVPGPAGEEFKQIVERVRIGKTLDEAVQDSADRLGLSEFAFFGIALAIQRETGGNLAETLSNLAEVLRKRAQMKLKVRAMSSESKASAYIVGALPFIVFALVYWANPNYLGEFFVDRRLMVAGVGGLVWMAIGAFVMTRMVSFEI